MPISRRAWGKLTRPRPDAWPDRFHRLEDHCADVAAVLSVLLETGSIRDRLRALNGGDLERSLRAAMVGAAFLHDIGKCNLGFWRKQVPVGQRGPGVIAGHVREASPLLFPSPGRAPIAIPKAGPFLDPGTPAGALMLAALGHHGEPLARDSLRAEAGRHRGLWQKHEDYEPVAEASALCDALATWLADSLEAAERLRNPTCGLLHGFAGLLSLADWIASNDAPGFFPYEAHVPCDRWAFARDRAVEVVKAMHLDPVPARAVLARTAHGFGDVFRSIDDRALDPNPLQAEMAALDLGPIVIAEAATGSGKTEAALWRFRALMSAGQVDGLAFLLPTRTAAMQIENRVREAVAAMWPDPADRPNTVLAVPGYLRADGEDGTKLPNFDVLWPDGDDDAAAHRRWAAESPKRSLAGAVVVGTIDQALLAALKVRHAHLRGACLLRLLLVVDEVHASDAYMTGLLRTLLDRHLAAGGHALLLSATLGAAARVRLLEPSPARRPKVPPLAEAEASAYPSIADQAGLRAVAGSGAPKSVVPALKPWLDDPRAIADAALLAAGQGARVLVVRNTVAGVLAVQQALEAAAGPEDRVLFRANNVVAPHHGRFAAPDRRVLDAAVETRFGKQADRTGGCVLVGSQTLEQSLDIDADLLLTDLCPMDVLLQRLGRLHRHDRQRPEGFAAPRALVVVPDRRDLEPFLPKGGRGSGQRYGLGGGVYPNLLAIEATWRLLEQAIVEMAPLVVPRDNRRLVERATHPDALNEIAEALGTPWCALRDDLRGVEAARSGLAAALALRWQDDLLEMRFPDRLDERVATRLGTQDRRLRLEPATQGPFGETLEEIVVPGWMARGLPNDVETVQVELRADGLLLRAGSLDFLYGRWGLLRCS